MFPAGLVAELAAQGTPPPHTHTEASAGVRTHNTWATHTAGLHSGSGLSSAKRHPSVYLGCLGTGKTEKSQRSDPVLYITCWCLRFNR